MYNHLAIMLHSGDYDRVHFALSMAASAAAIDKQVSIFVTMGACKAFSRDFDGNPGWKQLPLSNSMHTIMIKEASRMDSYFDSQDVPRFEDLLQSCIDLGTHFYVCDMGLRATGIILNDMIPSCQFQKIGLPIYMARLDDKTKLVTL